MTKLHISDELALPADAVTSTIVVYGGKGMGKTNLASVLVEEFASAGLRFAVIDPMGVWWGLRHAADGKGLGIKVLILGGIHGDLPITPESGVLVADLVVDEDASVIIDISRRADGSMWAERCPYGVIGDKLWCRETWRAVELKDGTDGIRFAADHSFQRIESTALAAERWVVAYDNGRHFDRWRPSIFMPRWASRITLDITNVRVERLQDISEEDAKAEGVEPVVTLRKVYPSKLAADVEHRSYREGFADLWRSINGAESWDANPWVWVVEFRRLEQARSAA